MQQLSRTELLAAALKVLAEAIRPMSCDELIRAMPASATCLPGRTPEHLLYAMLVRYRNQHGVHSPIHATGTGRFVWVQRGQKTATRGHVVR